MEYDVSEWLERTVKADDRHLAVKLAIKSIEQSNIRFNCIAVTGYSSATFGAILAHHFKVDLMLIRKEHDPSHSPYTNDGPIGATCLFIDDLVCTGATLQRVKDGVKQMEGQLVGVYLYADNDLHINNFAEVLENRYGVRFIVPLRKVKGVRSKPILKESVHA